MRPERPHFHPLVEAAMDATDAELADMGLMQRPVCDKCEGSGEGPTIGKPPASHRLFGQTTPCPSCGGSGFGRLVALDGLDVERVRRGSELLRQCIRPIEGEAKELLRDTLDSLDQVLAAMDQEDTP